MKNKFSSTIVGLKELRENMDNYISLVNKGMKITVVRRSMPVFTISAPESSQDDSAWEQVVDFTKIKQGGVNIKDVLKRI